MKAFAVWYFEWGWILTALIGAPVGFYAGKARKEWLMIAYLLIVFFAGLVLLNFKHS